MFDDFKNDQEIAYFLLKNSLACGKLSHAYLFDMNHYDYAVDFIMAFIKMIICPYHFSNHLSEKCNACSVCKRIENGNYPEVKIIETNSLVIKKEQLLDLQSEFSLSSIEGDYRIYVIKDCDKMNKQASNSLLKFLEEPVPGIIAILLTNHFGNVLSTIVSRCQVIHLNHVLNLEGKSVIDNLADLCCYSKESVAEFKKDDNIFKIIDCVINFILYFEENALDTLVFIKKMWYNVIQNRDDFLMAFLLMIEFYYDVLKAKVGFKNYFFGDREEEVKRVASFNSIDSVLKKIDNLCYGYEMAKCNLNINLLIDDIIIRLGE